MSPLTALKLAWRHATKLLIAMATLTLVACSEPETLTNLSVEFPQSELMVIDVVSSKQKYQFELPVTELSDRDALAKSLADLPRELRLEVIEMLESIEPPAPEPISPSLSRSVEALDHLLKSLGDDLSDLQQELQQHGDEYQRELEQNMGELSEGAAEMAAEAEQQAKGFLDKMQQQYVEHIARLIESGELSEEEITRLEQAIIAHHKKAKQ
ncbi:hypothetical protein GCM10011369_28480 [Neiella marina]|uniref:Uncharacterized protein n=1 Tax=Neiella marina TaxID=508461 RepID=A0A8J2U7Y8_9GAMM|nr:hypothetical protein [Neiella marina]GGA84763.1 hypothetical protein GCM10011369_28480 [Neiella marina]